LRFSVLLHHELGRCHIIAHNIKFGLYPRFLFPR
jgi:hypothetical protein